MTTNSSEILNPSKKKRNIDDDLGRSMMAPSIFDNPNSLRSDAETGELLGARPEATRFDDPLAMGATGPRRDVTPLSVIVPPENQVLREICWKEQAGPTEPWIGDSF